MRLKLIFLGFLWVAFGLTSCTLERELAMQYIEKEAPKTNLMVVPPDILFMFSDKALIDGDFKNKDSALFYQSKFLQYVSDSIFLETYFSAFAQQTAINGVNLFFPDQLSDFISQPNQSYIVRFAQMELLEDTTTFVVEESSGYLKSFRKIPYEMVSLGCWFEVSIKDSASYFTYFDEQFVNDQILGHYREDSWNNITEFVYTIDEMDLDDLYLFAEYAGKTHASYIFDLMLNTYIWNQLPAERKNGFIYLHYNAAYRTIEIAKEALTMLKNK